MLCPVLDVKNAAENKNSKTVTLMELILWWRNAITYKPASKLEILTAVVSAMENNVAEEEAWGYRQAGAAIFRMSREDFTKKLTSEHRPKDVKE